jgi:hypothetical protein
VSDNLIFLLSNNPTKARNNISRLNRYGAQVVSIEKKYINGPNIKKTNTMSNINNQRAGKAINTMPTIIAPNIKVYFVPPNTTKMPEKKADRIITKYAMPIVTIFFAF